MIENSLIGKNRNKTVKTCVITGLTCSFGESFLHMAARKAVGENIPVIPTHSETDLHSVCTEKRFTAPAEQNRSAGVLMSLQES